MRRLSYPRTSVLGGAVFAFLFSSGLAVEVTGGMHLWAFLLFLLLLWPLALCLDRLFALNIRGRQGTGEKHSLLHRFLFIFLLQIPWLIVHFPGSLAYDVPFQLRQVFTGAYSWHHPIVHTLFLGGCVKLGQYLGSVNLGAALYTLLQMACLSLVYAIIAGRLGRRSRGLGKAALLFYALYPLHPLMAINATKDTLFAGFFALAMLALLDNAGGPALIVPLTLALLFRNNLVYAVVPLLVLFLFLPDQRRLCLSLGASVLLYLVLFTGLNTLTKADKTERVEMLSVPIQQTARIAVRHEEELESEDLSLLEKVMPGRAWQWYDETVCDPVKFAMDGAALEENWGAISHLYMKLCLRYPGEALDAILCLGHPFLFPYLHYRESGQYLQTGVTQEYYDSWWQGEHLQDLSPVPRVRASIAWRFGANGGMPHLWGWLFNLGLLSYLMIFLCLRQLARRGQKGAGALLPLLLFGTCLLGPCMAGRYLYPFVSCLPVLFGGGKEEPYAAR